MFSLPSCQLICTAAQQIWPHQWFSLEKLPQFDLLHVKIPVVYINLWLFYLHVSWFVQLHSRFDLTTGLALKKYPNLTFSMLNSKLCISIYCNFTFMSADLYSCTADLTSPLDWPWKTTPFWPLICWNPCCVSQFMSILPSCQLICTAEQLICTAEQLNWPNHLICLEKVTIVDVLHVAI